MFSLILSTFYIIWLNIIHRNIYKVVNSSVALPSQVSGSKLVVQAFHVINYLFPFLWHTASLLQSKTHTYTHQCLGRLSFKSRLFMYRNMATFVNEVCCCILPHRTFNRVIIAEPTWYLTNIKNRLLVISNDPFVNRIIRSSNWVPYYSSIQDPSFVDIVTEWMASRQILLAR